MKKPKILILVMSASTEFFRNQIEDCKQTWLNLLDDNNKYKYIINKYTEKIDWLYYDTVDEIYNLKTQGNKLLSIDSIYNKKVVVDSNYQHHLQNVLFDDGWVWQKTVDIFDWLCNDEESEYKDYDYIIRTNTSTYINIISLVYYLYNEFNNIKQDIDWSEKYYSVELIAQPSVINIPKSGDIYGRGNLLVLPMNLVKNVILKYGQLHNSDTYNGPDCKICDDTVIGNILNCYFNDFNKKEPECYNYLNHICGLPFAWYKSVNHGYDIKHKWCKDGLVAEFTEENIEIYAGACGIQIKNYNDRSLESKHYKELHQYMCDYIYEPIYDEISILEDDIYNSIKEYTKNPSVFILGNIPYIDYNEYIEILKDKEKFHNFEMAVFMYLAIDINNYKYKERLINKYKN